MKCLIIEDERVAAERLMGLINKYDSSVEIIEIIQSVKNAVQCLNNNKALDLIFMDIHIKF